MVVGCAELGALCCKEEAGRGAFVELGKFTEARLFPEVKSFEQTARDKGEGHILGA